jgi:integrase
LDKLLPRPSKIARVEHHPAVAVEDVPAVVADIMARPGIAAQALLLQVLTAARSGEVRGARWPEIDFDTGVWVVPADRMKGHRMHRVSLSTQAVTLLKALPRFEATDLLFPSQRNTVLSDMALASVMRRMKLEAVPHGWRSSFRDWAGDYTDYPRDLIEMALAHAIDSKVEAAYRRRDMLDRRRALMQDWADYCLPQR